MRRSLRGVSYAPAECKLIQHQIMSRRLIKFGLLVIFFSTTYHLLNIFSTNTTDNSFNDLSSHNIPVLNRTYVAIFCLERSGSTW